MASEAGEKAERQEFDEQLELALEHVVEPIQRLLHAGEIEPHVIVFAVARAAGELAAAFATANGHDPEEVLGDIAEIVRRSGRYYYDALAEAMPVAGSA